MGRKDSTPCAPTPGVPSPGFENSRYASSSRESMRTAHIALAIIGCFAAIATMWALVHMLFGGVREFDRSNWGDLTQHVASQFADVSLLLGEDTAESRIHAILRHQDFVKSYEYGGNAGGIRLVSDAETALHEHVILLHTYTPVGSRAFLFILLNPVWYGMMVSCIRASKSAQRIILPAMCIFAISPASMAFASKLGLSGYLGILWAVIFSAIWTVKPSRCGMIVSMVTLHMVLIMLVVFAGAFSL